MKISKKITFLGLILMLLSNPVISYAQDRTTPDSEVSEIKVTISGSNVRVINASQNTLEVYNITGVRIASYRIDSADKTITLNLAKGCYILKIDRVVRKISLR